MPRSDGPSRKNDGDADPSRTDYQFLENLSTAYWQSEVLFSALDLKLFDHGEIVEIFTGFQCNTPFTESYP
jgi:hypothetical protein